MNRRKFMSTSLWGGVLMFTPMAFFTATLSSCKKNLEELEPNTNLLIEKLSALPRISTDIFTYLINPAQDGITELCKDFSQKYPSSVSVFLTSKKIVKTNFNIFDPIFSPLILKSKENNGLSQKLCFLHPEYPGLSFFIQETTLRNKISLPKESRNFYLINDSLFEASISKFS